MPRSDGRPWTQVFTRHQWIIFLSIAKPHRAFGCSAGSRQSSAHTVLCYPCSEACGAVNAPSTGAPRLALPQRRCADVTEHLDVLPGSSTAPAMRTARCYPMLTAGASPAQAVHTRHVAAQSTAAECRRPEAFRQQPASRFTTHPLQCTVRLAKASRLPVQRCRCADADSAPMLQALQPFSPAALSQAGSVPASHLVGSAGDPGFRLHYS